MSILFYSFRRSFVFSIDVKVQLTGTTIAGVSGSGGASYSQLNDPTAIYVDASNEMFILDTTNYRGVKMAER